MSQNLFWMLPEPFLDNVSVAMMTNDASKKGSEPEPYMVLAWCQAWHHSHEISDIVCTLGAPGARS
jgi:hypothetical protein